MSDAAGGLSAVAGRTYGPIATRIAAEKVAEFVAATGDPGAWEETAPPGYAAALLFTAAPAFLEDPDVSPHTSTLVHADQEFTFHRPFALDAPVLIEGVVDGVRDRRGLSFVRFAVSVSEPGGDAVLDSRSTFLMGSGPVGGGTGEERPEPGPRSRARDHGSSVPVEGGVGMVRSASRTDLVRYAGATGDWNPIHWDHATAVAAGLPGVVVHGLLTMAWLSQAAVSAAAGRTLARLKVRFRAPLLPAEAATIIAVPGGDGLSLEARQGEDVLAAGTADPATG